MQSSNRVTFEDDGTDKDRLEGIPYSYKRGRSAFEDMGREQKLSMMKSRLEEDKARAAQRIGELKKTDSEKKKFVLGKQVVGVSICNPMCISNSINNDVYTIGGTNGKIATIQLVKKKNGTVDSVETSIGKVDNPIIDIKCNSTGIIGVLDDTMTLSFFVNGKKVISLDADISKDNTLVRVGKFIEMDDAYFYYLRDTRESIAKISIEDITSFKDLKTFKESIIDVKMERKGVTGIAIHQERIFAVTEDGYLLSCVTFIKDQMSADEMEAYPDGSMSTTKRILQFNDEDKDLLSKFLKDDILEQDDPMMLIKDVISNTKRTETQYMFSVMDKSNVSKNKAYEKWQMAFFDHASLDLMYYQSIAACEDLVAVVVHDGSGLNCLCVYSHALVLKGMKLFKLVENDYTMNIHKSVQKLKIMKSSDSAYFIYASVQKFNFVLIFKYNSHTIKLITKVPNIHETTTYDMHVDGNSFVTTGRDKKICVVSVNSDYKNIDPS